MLTDAAIKATLPGDRLKDDTVRGLELRCHGSGRSWMLYYRTKTGIPRRPKIGDYPTVSLSAARGIARKMLVDVAAGRDPSLENINARGEATIDDLWDRCEREHWTGKKDWDKEAKKVYQRYIQPRIGKRGCRTIGYDDAKAMHAALAVTPVAANHALAILSKMLNLAECYGPVGHKWRDLNSNPCTRVERYVIAKRKRYATPDEVKQIGTVLNKYAENPEHLTGVAFLYLMLFSGARPMEIARGAPQQLERLEKDGKVYGVLRLHGKTTDATGELRNVFLPPQAMAVLDRLPPGRKHLAGRRSMPRRLWEAVCKELGVGKDNALWIRDLRRTFATIALSNGTTPGALGELLGHASVQTTKIYAKLIEDSAHRAAADAAEAVERMLGHAPVSDSDPASSG